MKGKKASSIFLIFFFCVLCFSVFVWPRIYKNDGKKPQSASIYFWTQCEKRPDQLFVTLDKVSFGEANVLSQNAVANWKQQNPNKKIVGASITVTLTVDNKK